MGRRYSRRILFLASNPGDTERLRFDREIREVEEGLRRAVHGQKFELMPVLAPRLRDIQRALLDHRPQIVHFSGHGDMRNLFLEGNDSRSEPVSSESFSELMRLFSGSIECVVLNSCRSKRLARMICRHVPCVVGMATQIRDHDSIAFSVAFYDALAAGRDYPFAFKLACNAVRVSSLSEELAPRLYCNSRLRNKTVRRFPRSWQLVAATVFLVCAGYCNRGLIERAFGPPGEGADAEQLPAPGQLTGRLIDEEAGVPLAGARVLIPEYGLETITNSMGVFRFQIELPDESLVRVVVVHEGFVTLERETTLGPGHEIWHLERSEELGP